MVLGATKRSRVLSRLVKQAERVAGRPAADLGVRADAESRRLRVALGAILNPPTGDAGIQDPAAYQLLGFLEGLESLDDARHAEAVLGLAPIAMVRWVELGFYANSGKTDSVLANALFLLGQEYLRFANWSLSFELFFYALVAGKDRKFQRRASALALVAAFNSGDPELEEAMLDQLADLPQKDLPLGRAVAIVRLRSGDVVPRGLEWFEAVASFGPLATALLAEKLIRHLTDEGRFQEALVICEAALGGLPVNTAPWLEATLLQARARVYKRNGETAAALSEASAAWTLTESLRFSDCEHELREMAWGRFLESRTIALACATALGDPLAVAQLLERDRLQGSVAATLEEPAQANERLSGSEMTSSSVTPPVAPGSDGPSAPQALFSALEDAFNSVTLNAPLAGNVTALDTRHIEWWFGIARYGSVAYWSVLNLGDPVDCGSIDLASSPFLARVIDDLGGDAAPNLLYLGGPAGDGSPGIDPHYHLSEWGTAEERMASSSLAEILPPPIRAALHKASTTRPLELVISAGSGLSGIPWPIIDVRDPRDPRDGTNFRLIERARIRHWASSTIEAKKLARSSQAVDTIERIPLLIAIDNPRADLAGTNVFLHANATAYFDSESSRLYGTDDVKAAIIDSFHKLCDGHPIGTFYYRGHAESDRDPAHARLLLPISEGRDLDDYFLPAGEFFGEFEEGHEWIPLPSRVVLSCCSSSSSELFGGETIGLAAACILGGGAWEVIATATDVYDCTFTSAFDDHLAEAMTLPVSHDEALRRVQVRMYDRWREFSLRGGISIDGDITYPHPLVWAMYQAI